MEITAVATIRNILEGRGGINLPLSNNIYSETKIIQFFLFFNHPRMDSCTIRLMPLFHKHRSFNQLAVK